MHSEQPINNFYEREGTEPFLEDLYNFNDLIEDLEKRGMEKAQKIIKNCSKLGQSLKDVFVALGQDEETRGDLQEIRTIFNKHKVKRNAEDKNS